MRLRINCDGLTSRSARVSLDDFDISAGLRAVSLTMAAGEPNEATITIRVDGVDIDAQALAMLRAHLDEQSAGEG